MQDLTVTLVQADQLWEDKEGNINNYEYLLTGVKTDLIVLPEMFNTGFSMNVDILAEKWNDSPSVNWLKLLAKEKEAAVYTSLIIKEEENYFNRGVFVFPTGEIQFYDKRKSFSLAREDAFFTAGTQEVIVDYKNWKIQLQICYDLRFPEIVRNKLDKLGSPKYDLILYVANWPKKRVHHWNTLLQARAIENQCYVVGANRVGRDNNDLEYNGYSNTFSALGEGYFSQNIAESAKTVKLSSKELQTTRKALPFLV